MKYKHLTLLTFLLSQSVSVYAMEPERSEKAGKSSINTRKLNEQLRELNEKTQASTSQGIDNAENKQAAPQAQGLKLMINEAIALAERKLSQGNPLNPKVIIIGPSGSGKSTLFNLLAGKELFVDEEYRLDAKDPILGSEIGHENTSQTAFPVVYSLEDLDLWDLPGFGETKGVEKDIVNLGMIRKICSGPLTILLTARETDLTGKASQFVKLLTYITRVFSYDQLEEGLSLVITQQGQNVYLPKPHTNLEKLLQSAQSKDEDSNKSCYAMNEDVKKLLTHLTKAEHINQRIPYFPFQGKIGTYDAEQTRKTILESLKDRAPIQNPQMNIELSLEANDHVAKLAKELNGEIKNTLDMCIKPKIVNLCKESTNAYAREDSMPNLAKSLKAITSAMTSLDDDGEENMLNFAGAFDDCVDLGSNPLTEHIKAFLFLKTLKTDLEFSKEPWRKTLKSALDEIHDLIDSLGKKLSQKVCTSLEKVQCEATQSCATLQEGQSKETYIEGLNVRLNKLNAAIEVLERATHETLIKFVDPLEIFFTQHQKSSGQQDDVLTPQEDIKVSHVIKTAQEALEIIGFLSAQKVWDYPKQIWLNYLNPSAKHMENIIADQLKIIDQNRRLEEEARVRAEKEETIRFEREEARRNAEEQRQAHLAEVARMAENARLEREEAERKAEADRQANLKLVGLVETAEAKRQAKKQAHRVEVARITEDARLEKEEATRKAEEDAQKQANLTDALRKEQEERQVEAAAALERQREAEQQHRAEVEAQQAAQEEAIRREQEEAARRVEEQRQERLAEVARAEENARVQQEEAERRHREELEAQRVAQEEVVRREQEEAERRVEEQRQARVAEVARVQENARIQQEQAARRAEEEGQKQAAEAARLTNALRQEQQARQAENAVAAEQRQAQERVARAREEEDTRKRLQLEEQAREQAQALNAANNDRERWNDEREVQQQEAQQQAAEHQAQVNDLEQKLTETQKKLTKQQNAEFLRLIHLKDGTKINKAEYDLLPKCYRSMEIKHGKITYRKELQLRKNHGK